MLWYDVWRRRLTETIARPDWPPIESPWWTALRNLVAATDCDEPTADAALDRLFGGSPHHIDQFPAAVAAAIRTVQDEARHAAEDQERARRQAETDPERAAHASYRRQFDALPEIERQAWLGAIADEHPGLALLDRERPGIGGRFLELYAIAMLREGRARINGGRVSFHSCRPAPRIVPR